MVPSILELEKNISFRIINTHQSMTFARPRMPGLSYVAGIHIKPPKLLPSDVQVSLSEQVHSMIPSIRIFFCFFVGISGHWI